MKLVRVLAVAVVIGLCCDALILLWCGGFAWLANSWKARTLNGYGYDARLCLIVLGLILLGLALGFLFSRRRLVFLSILSLLAILVLAVCGVGGFKARTDIEWGISSMRMINGQNYYQNKNLRIENSQGGMLFQFQVNFAPPLFGWVPDPNDERMYLRWKFNSLWQPRYPFAGKDYIPDRAGSRPIPRWGGFDSAWYISSAPPGPGDPQILCGITLPIWFLILICMIPPAVWIRRYRRERYRILHEICPACGFDLRAHKTGEKCPECGRPKEETSQQKASDASPRAKPVG